MDCSSFRTLCYNINKKHEYIIKERKRVFRKMPKKWRIVLILVVVFTTSSFSYAAKKSKWQAMLERNSVPQEYWQKYLPKVSRKEDRKAVKNFLKSQESANQEISEGDSGDSGAGIKVTEGKYSLPASSGKIAREQHLWLKSDQSASSHYKMTDTPSSARNGMAGGDRDPVVTPKGRQEGKIK